MTRKKDIENLISGIVGGQQSEDEHATDIPQEVVERLGITPDLEDKLNEERRRHVGRRAKNDHTPKIDRSGEVRATFIVNRDDVRKIKYVALMEGKLMKDIVAEMIHDYLDKWSAEHGRDIVLPGTDDENE